MITFKHFVRFALVLTSLAALTGCPPPANSLDGLVKTSHDLTFTSDELRFLSDQKVYQLSYFKQLNAGDASNVDVVVKVTFDEPEGGVVPKQAINLKNASEEATVERVTAANDPFPASFRIGEITFATPATVGQQVTGEFAVTFDNGETLSGTFQVVETDDSFAGEGEGEGEGGQ